MRGNGPGSGTSTTTTTATTTTSATTSSAVASTPAGVTGAVSSTNMAGVPVQPDVTEEEVKLVLALMNAMLDTHLTMDTTAEEWAEEWPEAVCKQLRSGVLLCRLLNLLEGDAVINMTGVHGGDEITATEPTRQQPLVLSNMTLFVNAARGAGCALSYVDASGLAPPSDPPADLLVAVVADLIKNAAKHKAKVRSMDSATQEEQQGRCSSCSKPLTPRFYSARGRRFICTNCISLVPVAVAVVQADFLGTDTAVPDINKTSATPLAASRSTVLTATTTSSSSTPRTKTSVPTSATPTPVPSAPKTASAPTSKTSSVDGLTASRTISSVAAGEDDDDDIFGRYEKTKKVAKTRSTSPGLASTASSSKTHMSTSPPPPASSIGVDTSVPQTTHDVSAPAPGDVDTTVDSGDSKASRTSSVSLNVHETDDDSATVPRSEALAVPSASKDTGILLSTSPSVSSTTGIYGSPVSSASSIIPVLQSPAKKTSASASTTNVSAPSEEDAIFSSFASSAPKAPKPTAPRKQPSAPSPAPTPAEHSTSDTPVLEPIERPFSPPSNPAVKTIPAARVSSAEVSSSNVTAPAPSATTQSIDEDGPVVGEYETISDIIVRQAELRGALEALEQTLSSAATDSEQVQATETELLREWNTLMTTKDRMTREDIIARKLKNVVTPRNPTGPAPSIPPNGGLQDTEGESSEDAPAADQQCVVM